MKEEKLNKIFTEIKKGFSELTFQGSLFYVKHPGVDDIAVMEEDREALLLKAKGKGVPTEEELLKTLDETEQWTKKDEEELLVHSTELKNLKQTLINLFKDSEKKKIQQRIDEIETKHLKNKKIRNELTRISAENYADKKSNETFLQKTLFLDVECKELRWKKSEFDELDVFSLQKLYNEYNEVMDKFSDKNIQQLSISGMFKNLLNLYDKDLSGFFKKHPLDLSYYQINLLNYGKMFKSIFENKEIPDDISKDAGKILAYLEESKVKKEKAKRVLDRSNNSDGFSYVGASKKDLEKMGVREQRGKGIHDIAKEKGGELNMEDFMNMHKK
jgi:hypothetical protein